MARTWTRAGRWLGAAWVAAAGLLAPMAHAEEPRAACTATLSGRRVVVRPEASAFISPELDRLVRLGMAGRVEVEVTLFKRHSLWFDARVDVTRLTQVLVFSRGTYVLDGRSLPEGPGVLELERVAWTLEERPEAGDRFLVQVEVRLHVVTAASLGRVASWLTQEKKNGEEERSGITSTLLRSVAEDLSRTASGRCDVSRAP
ncbi:hypothetical protein JY651_32735 [Pyxidicoccus parkwayensis]|uniref:DUF4390 domain-containing protein n=1 Tax=Pyxidicoccus parkwayensis TaxID=2813578 RepID=A0ABX7NNM5_9BACT|nr:hypothetical protein [Pyxidicoccus parkwaysis]QSQ20023.1 hypothetical protein JY651_32735 [Pyxidicoccus parkwaysis]